MSENNKCIYNLQETIDRVKSEVKDDTLRDSILSSLDILNNYMTLDGEHRILKTSVPLGSILYLCAITPVNPEDMSEETNKSKVNFDILQKAFVPSTVYFDILNVEYGRSAFDNVVDAIIMLNKEFGIDECIARNFPTVNDDGSINDNGSTMLTEFTYFDKRISKLNIIHSETTKNDFKETPITADEK